MKKHRTTPASSTRRRARSSAVVEGGSVRRYIESSALVAALMEGDAAARASVRAPIGKDYDAATTGRTAGAATVFTPLLHSEHQRADPCSGRTPVPSGTVRTLDAIHLATVQAVAEAPGLWVVVTRDQRIRDNAIALGYSVE